MSVELQRSRDNSIVYGSKLPTSKKKIWKIPEIKDAELGNRFLILIDYNSKRREALYTTRYEDFVKEIDILSAQRGIGPLLCTNVVMHECTTDPLPGLLAGKSIKLCGIRMDNVEDLRTCLERGITILHQYMKKTLKLDDNEVLRVNAVEETANNVAEQFVNTILEENDAFLSNNDQP